MQVLHYYTRTGCHLCEIMLEELLPLIRGKVELEIRCVDSRDDWREKYDIRVPVVESGGQIISEYPLNLDSVHAFLARTT
ncbi:MAG: glutaredoxin family protein [Gammaproteobacteria bacterium]|nr:glutaredoxin family protein [Gammaproteobacteria bacterium]